MSSQIDDLLKKISAATKAHKVGELIALSGELQELVKKNVAAYPDSFVIELKEAVTLFDRKRVQDLCQKLVAYIQSRGMPYPLTESKKIISLLRRKRYFDTITRVADIMIQVGRNEPVIRRHYAQALIDLGYISAALDVLKILKKDCLEQKDSDELAETRGLIGRAYKQIYIDGFTGQPPTPKLCWNLEQAISAYSEVYEEEKKHSWHGVNTVALLERAKYDRVKIAKKLPNASKIAKEILEGITSKEQPDLWDCATASEACLALKDYSQSFNWIYKYTQENPAADAFEYAGTLRQFEEVWRLDDKDREHARILHLLREAILRQEGGKIEIDNLAQNLVTASELENDKEFEQILGKDRYKTFQWYRMGLERATGIAQILDRSGNGKGTGFLVRGLDLHESFGEDWVLVTNAHVISDDPREQNATPAALPSHEVEVRFEAICSDRQCSVKAILYSSSRSELDCTILSLQSPVEHVTPYPVAKRLPLVGKNQRVYVIGHPRGGGLSYSIDDNLLLDHEKPKVHYRTPTEGGSSGSPVFNQQWDLIAVHHAGGTNMKRLNDQPGYYPANQGLCFQCIKEAIAEDLA